MPTTTDMVTITGAPEQWARVVGSTPPGQYREPRVAGLSWPWRAPDDWWVRRHRASGADGLGGQSGGPVRGHVVAAADVLAQAELGGRARLRTLCRRTVAVSALTPLEVAEAPGVFAPDDWRTCPDCRGIVSIDPTGADRASR